MIKDAVRVDRTSVIFTRLKTMSHIKGIIHCDGIYIKPS